MRNTYKKLEPFYMVYAEGKSTPAYKHQCLELARAEALRLSRKLGVDCYVLEAKDCTNKPVEVEVMEPAKLYWYLVTDDPIKNAALFNRLTELSGAEIPDLPEEDGCIYYNAGDVIYNKGKDIKVSKYGPAREEARSAYYIVQLFGTELRIKEE